MSEYANENEKKQDDHTEGNTGNDADTNESTDPGNAPGEGDEQK